MHTGEGTVFGNTKKPHAPDGSHHIKASLSWWKYRGQPWDLRGIIALNELNALQQIFNRLILMRSICVKLACFTCVHGQAVRNVLLVRDCTHSIHGDSVIYINFLKKKTYPFLTLVQPNHQLRKNFKQKTSSLYYIFVKQLH